MTGAGKKLSFAYTTDREPDTLDQHIVMVLEAFLTFLFGVPNAGYVMSIQTLRRHCRSRGLVSVVPSARATCRTSTSLPA